MIVLDAGVLIGYLEGDDKHHAEAEDLLAAHVAEEFGANSLTLAEVFDAPARSGRLAETQLIMRELEVAELSFPADAAVRLAQLRADTGLKMPDCCVLLAAEALGARLATFDDRLSRAARSQSISLAAR